jgi:hypothetical protein
MQYISAKDGNKLIRKALKEAFPGVKFSVRGTDSTNVNWVDGPTEDEVSSIVSRFAGSYFDGMIDYKGSIYAEMDGNPVGFLADFIFCNRSYSDDAVQSAIDEMLDEYKNDPYFQENEFTVDGFKSGKYWNAYWYEGSFANDSVQRLIHKKIAKTSYVDEVKESETANRVRVVGDDNYGYSGVNPDSPLNGYPKN